MNKVDRHKVPYHFMRLVCHNCYKTLGVFETNDWNDENFKKAQNRLGLDNYCNNKCKTEYMLKKIGGNFG